MEKKLMKMRKNIEAREKRTNKLLACTVAFLCVSINGIIPVELGNQNHNDFVFGFQCGLLTTLLFVLFSSLLKYRKALKDDKLLKQLYYKENDERMCYIHQQVGKSSLQVTMLILVIATVIVGYFNFTAFLTMLAVILLQGLIQIALKWYYTNMVSEKDSID